MSLDHEILSEYEDFGAVVAVLGSRQARGKRWKTRT
jgi:hypothetical protein